MPRLRAIITPFTFPTLLTWVETEAHTHILLSNKNNKYIIVIIMTSRGRWTGRDSWLRTAVFIYLFIFINTSLVIRRKPTPSTTSSINWTLRCLSRALYRDKWRPIRWVSDVAVGHPFVPAKKCGNKCSSSDCPLWVIANAEKYYMWVRRWQPFTNYR